MAASRQDIIIAIAKELKLVLKKPDWADFVKTGTHKEKPPMDSDWWYMRAASILMKVDKLGPVGVSKLRTKYGGRKNNGVAPEHFRRAGGSIIRKALQQLDKEGLIKKETGKHKGRIITAKAHKLIAKAEKSLGKSHAKPKAAEAPQ